MTPTKVIFDRDIMYGDALVVKFSGGKVPNLPLICIITGEGILLLSIFLLICAFTFILKIFYIYPIYT